MNDQIIEIQYDGGISPPKSQSSRRAFIEGSLGAILLSGVAGCCTSRSGHGAVNLGEGDTGILNYAYALEGLEAAFYSEVLAYPYPDMNDFERMLLTDIRDHEVAHREFFKRALGQNAIPPLQYNFRKVNFNSRKHVLQTAYRFENVGIGAYNGAGRHLSDPANLTIAGKIVSVEARHAAALGYVIDPGSKEFDKHGLDHAWSSSHVLKAIDPYLVTKISPAHWGKREE